MKVWKDEFPMQYRPLFSFSLAMVACWFLTALLALGTALVATPPRNLRGLTAALKARMHAALLLMLLFSTCAFAGSWTKPVFTTSLARTFFYEQDFVADPTLVALPNQVAVLTLLPASGTSPSLQPHKVRYQLSSGKYNFCLKGDPSLTTMTATDPSGQVVVSVNVNACSTVDLPTNAYGISIWHDPAKVAGKPRIIFVQLPAPHVKTINVNGAPKSGYWALQPDPAQDPTKAGRLGRLHALPQQNMSTLKASWEVVGMPLAADWTSTEFDDTALLRLDAPKLYANDVPLNFFPVPNAQDQNYNALLFGNSVASYPNYLDQVVIDDRADGTVRVGATSQTLITLLSFFYLSPRWAFVGSTSFLTFPPLVTLNPPPPSLLARLQFRFFPESKNLPAPALEQGEVELFQSCGYSGDATVFNRDIADLAVLASSTAKVNQAAAVKLGPNTQVILYSEPGFAGTSQTLASDTNCFDSLPIGTSIGSLQIRPPIAPFSVSSGCSSCQLQGINLSNSVLDGALLSGTDLSNANLTGASLIGTALEDVNLSQATISQAHFDNADMKGTSWFGVDLRTAASFANLILDRASGFGGANLAGVDLTDASLREIDFNFTNLSNAKLLHADLTGANLVQSKLIGTQLTNRAILQKADLSVSTLTNAQLTDADLTHACLDVATANANFTGAHLDSSSLAGTDFRGATLNGATFAGADIGNAFYTLDQLRVANLYQAVFDKQTFLSTNLSGLNFSGASFKGAVFQNITCGGPTNFTGADLTGATFKQNPPNNLSGCNFNGAILQKATLGVQLGSSTFQCVQIQANLQCAQMQGAQLVGADLTGTDLTGANLTSANLRNAILTNPLSLNGAIFDEAVGLAGGNLSGAQLSNVSLRHTNLSGTKLYGAQLNGANLDGSNLSGAFLTKPPGGGAAANLGGAFLRNVNLSQAQLSGADFTNASFYGTIAVGTGTCAVNANTGFTNNCATADHAVLNNTQFGGAYLFGVDFTSAQIQGVQFANTVLTGANFNKAKVSLDSTIGTNSGFAAAFLEGTNLASTASLQGVSLANAFVDFSPTGNTMYLPLSGTHTNFPGYWGPPGEPVCAEMSYPGPSLVPTNNSTITCPDGHTYPPSPSNPGGCGPATSSAPPPLNQNWKSPVDITQFASYQFDATFTKAPTSGQPICAYDPNWISSQTSQPGSPHRPKPHPPHRF